MTRQCWELKITYVDDVHRLQSDIDDNFNMNVDISLQLYLSSL